MGTNTHHAHTGKGRDMARMRTLTEVAGRPSAFDSRSNYTGVDLDTLSAWRVVMTRTRDSGLLDQSNWDCALKQLGGEGDNVAIHRFRHWACGWWEALCVTGDKVSQGQSIVDKLDGYPVLNDDDYSERQWEQAQETWATLSIKERVELCQRFGCKVLEARHDYIPQSDNGGLFDYLTME